MFPPELLLLKVDELRARAAGPNPVGATSLDARAAPAKKSRHWGPRVSKVAAYKALDDIMGQSVSEEQWNGCVLQKDQAHGSLRPKYQQLHGLAKGTPKFHSRSE